MYTIPFHCRLLVCPFLQRKGQDDITLEGLSWSLNVLETEGRGEKGQGVEWTPTEEIVDHTVVMMTTTTATSSTLNFKLGPRNNLVLVLVGI